MIIAFLAFILAWPILTALAFSALVLFLLATEHEFWSSALIVGTVALVLYAFHEIGSPIAWSALGYIAGAYVGIGFLFTIPKWYLWAQKMGRKFGVIKADYDKNPKKYRVNSYNDDITPLADVWNKNYSKNVMNVQLLNGRWDVYYYKPALVGYLTSWILNWPFYAVLLVIEDFIVELVNWFADRVGKTFRVIATKAFNDNIKIV